MDLKFAGNLPFARLVDPPALPGAPVGAACEQYGPGLTEPRRLPVGLGGPMRNVSGAATGGAQVEWRAAPPDPRHR